MHADENYSKKRLCYILKNGSLFSNPDQCLPGDPKISE